MLFEWIVAAAALWLICLGPCVAVMTGNTVLDGIKERARWPELPK